MPERRKICIITPNYISGSPRTVKEADALSAAGYDVRVVFSQGPLTHMREFDQALIEQKSWRADFFGWSPHGSEAVRFVTSAMLQKVARRMPWGLDRCYPLAEIAQGRIYHELARVAAAEKADLYIGHYSASLAAAVRAARNHRTQAAYDFEDYYVGQGNNAADHRQIEAIERRNLPECAYTSAASTLMADALARYYAIPSPIPIYNVFPWSDRATLDGQIKDRRGDALSVYWYSQTIGLDRGIQEAIRAAGLVQAPIQIHLRGALSNNVRDALLSLAAECGVAQHLHFHERVSPTELLSRAVEHDIGLAAETGKDLNNAITSSNKLFFYLLAGLCVAATDVPGQRHVMETIPEAGMLYPVGDHVALAAFLQRMIDHPEELNRHKQAALTAARDRWNWEIESQKLVEAVTKVLNNPSKRSPR